MRQRTTASVTFIYEAIGLCDKVWILIAKQHSQQMQIHANCGYI
jgi:hypothetical protein